MIGDGHNPPIRIWRYEDAPEDLQALSPHGGDEDWLALVPSYLSRAWIPWLEEPHFACCSVSRHELPGGAILVIGAHA